MLDNEFCFVLMLFFQPFNKNYDINDNTTMSSLAVKFVKCENSDFSHISFDVKFVMISFTTASVVVFATVVLCQILSVSSSCDSDAETRKFYLANICDLHKQSGSCKLKWKRFFFNRTSGSCEQFSYEGEYFCFRLTQTC